MSVAIASESSPREDEKDLVELAQLPNVTLQVLPFTAGACQGGPYPFLIYSFPPPAGLEVVLLENFASHAYLETREDTARLGGAFDHLRAAALSAMESESRIIGIAEGLPDS
ncbi:Scr1 family TA system antitoxin-like transcriptional regulator [Streptomyces sp. B21-083]|uniref:Scr1 family TA system antitoxin-like transcriptional regulator n=1 Tax=Streptomyces sp. B21-083 TaxID=3039410 RepID=UPI002FF3972A